MSERCCKTELDLIANNWFFELFLLITNFFHYNQIWKAIPLQKTSPMPKFQAYQFHSLLAIPYAQEILQRNCDHSDMQVLLPTWVRLHRCIKIIINTAIFAIFFLQILWKLYVKISHILRCRGRELKEPPEESGYIFRQSVAIQLLKKKVLKNI